MRRRKQELIHDARWVASFMTGWWSRFGILYLILAATATISAGQSFQRLFSFDSTDGANPYASLVQGANGNFYGTTYYGGANYGTVFEMTPAGKLTTLYSFCSQTSCSDGYYPEAGLVQATNGNFYGTTLYGGANNWGTVFEITPAAKLTTLYSFCSQTNCTDGSDTAAGLVQAPNGKFYGTTFEGGAYGGGTVFEITPTGKLTTLYSFCSQTNCTDGSGPVAGLVQATNGKFYGTTSAGGTSSGCGVLGCGTVFEITPTGKLTTLYSFCSQTSCTDGANPVAGLVQATNGSFYGTTDNGGANGLYDGTVFEINPTGKLTTLYSFCSQTNCADGIAPYAGLVQATDGNFYGTTTDGGAYGGGTVFEITSTGNLTTLYSFCSQTNCTDGSDPAAGMVQATDGQLYGTTYNGGRYSLYYGTVFALSIGLGPFVEILPTSGKVGAQIKILGTDLTGANGVSFDGAAAVFEVVSKSLISATVPTGATSGFVTVTTPSGMLKSNVKFRVRP